MWLLLCCCRHLCSTFEIRGRQVCAFTKHRRSSLLARPQKGEGLPTGTAMKLSAVLCAIQSADERLTGALSGCCCQTKKEDRAEGRARGEGGKWIHAVVKSSVRSLRSAEYSARSPSVSPALPQLVCSLGDALLGSPTCQLSQRDRRGYPRMQNDKTTYTTLPRAFPDLALRPVRRRRCEEEGFSERREGENARDALVIHEAGLLGTEW